ncbi:MAG: sugar ABC transporter permease [Ruminococcus sp.]|nr:sugar ABC transporter permease [Ruminococcus sp.]
MKKIYHNPVGTGRFTGLFLISPFIIGFAVFVVYPLICSFVVGLTDYDNIHTPEFTGLENYRKMLTDGNFLKSLATTLKYTCIFVPLKIIISLSVALLLSLEIKGIGIFRTVFYIPSILGANLAVVIMWQYLFTYDGFFNQLIVKIGLPPISWYGDPECSLWIIIFLRLWEFGSTMVIFLTALHDIPREYYDASRTDGCGKVKSFFLITLPLMKNVIFMNVVLQTISALQEFNAPYMITGGKPLKSTYTVGMLIYDEMFVYHNAGYANAVSWVLFVVISAVIALVFMLARRKGRDV